MIKRNINEVGWSVIKKVLSYLKEKFLYFTLLVIAGLFLFFFLPTQLIQFSKTEFKVATLDVKKVKEEYKVVKLFEEALPLLEKRWLLGDVEGNFANGNFTCPSEIGDFKSIDADYLRCNPNYLQCFFESQTGIKPSFEVTLEKNHYHVTAKPLYNSPKRYNKASRFYKLVKHTNENLVELTLTITEIPGSELKVYLKPECNQSYLPQRKYLYGMSELWNNFGSHIFIDTHLVTFRDLTDWIDYGGGGGETDADIPNDSTGLASFAYGVKPDAMKKYCAFRGKQLLTSYLFDAATFYPQELNNPTPTEIRNFPYPFSLKTQDVFLSKIQRDPKLNVSEQDCKSIYIQDCLTITPYKAFFPYATSWIDLHESMGGPFEYLYNPIEKNLSIKASSFYFNKISPFHYLGLRLKWDENGFSSYNFEGLIDHDGQTKYKVGFRCFQNENVDTI